MRKISGFVLWGMLLLACPIICHGEEGMAKNAAADDALKQLMEGNQRYTRFQISGFKHSDAYARKALAKSQKPFAIILSCSDSRVPPEIIFDKGLGELFVVRVAGNIADPIVLGSIEYAAEHLGTPLIMVLGHERCGAVTATVDAHGEAQGNIGAIVKSIQPAAEKARQVAVEQEKSILVETAIDENIRLVTESLTHKSPVLEEMAKEGTIKIVSAKYDLDDGKVTLLQDAEGKKPVSIHAGVKH